MSGRDDWAPGDLALCVTDRVFVCHEAMHVSNLHLSVGKCFEVAAVSLRPCGCMTLCLGDHYGHAPRFIKVTPPADMKADAEPIALEQRKPERVAV